MNLHGRIMNLTEAIDGASLAYSIGHRDARHAAAELALQEDALNAQLLEALKLAALVLSDLQGCTQTGSRVRAAWDKASAAIKAAECDDLVDELTNAGEA